MLDGFKAVHAEVDCNFLRYKLSVVPPGQETLLLNVHASWQ